MTRLQSLREASGMDLEALSLVIQVAPEMVGTWEVDYSEAIEQLELQQWAAWAHALGLPLIEMLAQIGLCQPGAVLPITFRELRDGIGELAGRKGGLHFVEEATGWDLGDFIRDPEDGWSRKLGFFQSMAKAIGKDWRGVIAAYGAPV